MAPRVIKGLIMIPFLVLLSVSFCSCTRLKGINGVEDIEIDRQLKVLNKPYTKSIKTEEGDVFDCIDIHKQPAFDHPLLKNHSIQMKPSGFPKELVVKATSPAGRPFAKGLSKGCLFGTVPIKRVRKEDLLIWSKENSHPTAAGSTEFHYATRILGSSDRNYFGASAVLDIQNPQVLNNQFSQAFVQIRSGPGAPLNTIRFGWMVNPKLFGDSLTRTFATLNTGENGCFNNRCSGFVQVSKTFPLGYVLKNISIYGGEQFVVRCIIFKDPKSGNWWLAHDDEKQTVGYWPNSLFTSLSRSASEITWGGGVYSADSSEANPPMGNGHFADEDFKKAAYFRFLRTIDESNNLVLTDDSLLQYFTDSPKCYTIGALEQEEHAFQYGGPGGNCGV